MNTCQPPDVHVWTPLRPGWEPDVTTPCDCGVEEHGNYWRKKAFVALMSSPARGKWDVARRQMRCASRGCVIGQGEQFRWSKTENPYCIPCAKRQFNDDPPADVPVVRVTDQLHLPTNDTTQCSPAVAVIPEHHQQPTVTRAEIQYRRSEPVDVRMRQAGSD